MQKIPDKLCLGLALSQTFDDTKINKQRETIMDIYRNVFKNKFQEIPNNLKYDAQFNSEFLAQHQNLTQSYFKKNKDEEKKYYKTALQKLFITDFQVMQNKKNRQFGLIQECSNNENPKRKKDLKNKNQIQTSPAPRKQIKMN